MHQFGWISERGGNFLNLLQKEGGSIKKLCGWGVCGWVGSKPEGNYGKSYIKDYISFSLRGHKLLFSISNI